MQKIVDIIIPVYRGLDEVRRCLDSVYRAKCITPFQVIAINDCGPEPDLLTYLREQAALGLLELHENSQNLGFVRTVNYGMGLHPDRDVLLLNSDTEVAGDWLDRLHTCAYRDDRIGTATPFSNNATICSYPKFCADNEIPPGQTYNSLDALFAKHGHGLCFDVPTGVGFCMYIKRACLAEVGEFDYKTFGLGYGEENDFCMRARSLRWRNVLCADVFVYHVGAVSFGASQQTRLTDAYKLLVKKHPRYPELVRRHIEDDPASAVRLAVDFERLQQSPLPKVLLVNLNFGGGTEKHVFELAKFMRDRAEFIELRMDASGLGVSLRWLKSGEAMRLNFRIATDYEKLIQLLQDLSVSRVHFHHTTGIHEKVLQIPERLGVPYDFTAHDYYSFCPRTDLTGTQGFYCGEPDAEACQVCIRTAPKAIAQDIYQWRDSNQVFLAKADRVIAPTKATAGRLSSHFRNLNLITVPHVDLEGQDLQAAPVLPKFVTGEKIRVVIVGALDKKKGRDVLIDVARLSLQRKLPIEFHLIGYLRGAGHNTKGLSNLIIHGSYSGDVELDRQLIAVRPHLSWFQALTPETFSYTLSAVLKRRLPVLASNLGAFNDRLNGRSLSWTMDWAAGPVEWLKKIQEIVVEMQIPADSALVGSPEAPSNEWYKTQYVGLTPVVLSNLAQPQGWTAAELLPHAVAWAPKVTPIRRFASTLVAYSLRVQAVRNLKDAIPMKWKARLARWLRHSVNTVSPNTFD